jgi:hypothetical protein
MTDNNQWYCLYWTSVAHLIKPDMNGCYLSVCGKASALSLDDWNLLEDVTNPPRRCIACDRIAKGIQGKYERV